MEYEYVFGTMYDDLSLVPAYIKVLILQMMYGMRNKTIMLSPLLIREK